MEGNKQLIEKAVIEAVFIVGHVFSGKGDRSISYVTETQSTMTTCSVTYHQS